jgi:hypothetical protein
VVPCVWKGPESERWIEPVLTHVAEACVTSNLLQFSSEGRRFIGEADLSACYDLFSDLDGNKCLVSFTFSLDDRVGAGHHRRPGLYAIGLC